MAAAETPNCGMHASTAPDARSASRGTARRRQARRVSSPLSQRKALQEDDDEAITSRVPIVLQLGGLLCRGTEEALPECPGFELGARLSLRPRCSHSTDVYLVCSNGPDPGAPHSHLNRRSLRPQSMRIMHSADRAKAARTRHGFPHHAP